MRWWRLLRRRWARPEGEGAARDETRDETRAAAAMARLRGQCGVAAGECVPWDAQGHEENGEFDGASETGEAGVGDERR